jgi:hypothetical protein
MKYPIPFVTILTIVTFLMIGCGGHPDTDVSSTSAYNFSSFARTSWNTKVKVGIVELEDHRGRRVTCLESPQHFDSTHPKYTPPQGMHVITVLPVGTRLRIDRLMKDNGVWGGVWVTAILDEGTSTQRVVDIDPMLLAKNKFIWVGSSSSTNWDVNPEMLEK